jgi:phosphoglycolate phosphatase
MSGVPVYLIDLDGTLVDTLADLNASVNYTLAALGQPSRTIDEVRSFVGHGVTTLLARALASETPAVLDRARELFFEHYEAHLLDHSRIYAGWEGVLNTELTLVCATNKPERFARQILDGLGLSARFRLLVGGDTLPVKKPDVAVAAFVAERVGCGVEDLIMVGDGPADGELAARCRFPFWAVRWGYGANHELAPFATRWLDGPAEIAHAAQAFPSGGER